MLFRCPSTGSQASPLPHDDDDLCAVLYRSALELLPRWLQDPDRCRDLWADEDAQLGAGLSAIASGAVTVEEDPALDLAIVTLPADGRSSGHRFVGRAFTGVHPMALHRATDRITILTLDPSGGRHELTSRYEGWVQLRSRPVRPRVDLLPLADRLSAAENGGVAWEATPPSDITPRLRTTEAGPPSAIDPRQVVAEVEAHLREAPAAWNPFMPGSCAACRA